MKMEFPRDIGALTRIFGFVRTFAEREHLQESHTFFADLVIEELFTNMVKYNDGRHDIAVDLDVRDNRLFVSVTDFQVQPFDVTGASGVNTSAPLEERTPGGLGLHLIRSMADDVVYSHENGNSTVTVIKELVD